MITMKERSSIYRRTEREVVVEEDALSRQVESEGQLSREEERLFLENPWATLVLKKPVGWRGQRAGHRTER
jgi:hypothetical protein